MIEVVIVLAIVGWIASLSKDKLKSEVRSSTAESNFCLTCHEDYPDIPADYFGGGNGDTSRPVGAPMQESGFNPDSNCGDAITDYKIKKNVVFKAVAGTAVQGLTLITKICNQHISTLELKNVPQKGGVITNSQSWSTELYAGNYTLTILNSNGTDMPNDGNLGDNQISISIDGFDIGELPMTLSQDFETYNLIVNPD